MSAHDIADRVAAAAARLGQEPAEAWRPDDRSAGHPHEIAGVVVERSVKVAAGFNGDDVTVVTVRVEEGRELAVWCFGKVLEQDLAGAQLGDVVAVQYRGRKQGRNAEYVDYRVVVDRTTAAPAAAPPASDDVDRRAAEPVAEPKPRFCSECGGREPEHREACSNDIPF